MTEVRNVLSLVGGDVQYAIRIDAAGGVEIVGARVYSGLDKASTLKRLKLLWITAVFLFRGGRN